VWLDARKEVKIDLGKIKVQTVLVLDLIGGEKPQVPRLRSGGTNEECGAAPPALDRLPMDPALPGWADFWCRPYGPGLQTPLSQFIPPLTCRRQVGLGMTKGRAALSFVIPSEAEGSAVSLPLAAASPIVDGIADGGWGQVAAAHLVFGYAAQCLGYGRLGNPIRLFDRPA
jgi:hypothetical protein